MLYLAGRENCLQQDKQIPSCMLAAGVGPAPREESRLMAEISMTFFFHGEPGAGISVSNLAQDRAGSAVSWLSYKPQERWKPAGEIGQNGHGAAVEQMEPPYQCSVFYMLIFYFHAVWKDLECNYWLLFNLISEASLACLLLSWPQGESPTRQRTVGRPRPLHAPRSPADLRVCADFSISKPVCSLCLAKNLDLTKIQV